MNQIETVAKIEDLPEDRITLIKENLVGRYHIGLYKLNDTDRLGRPKVNYHMHISTVTESGEGYPHAIVMPDKQCVGGCTCNDYKYVKNRYRRARKAAKAACA